MTDRERLMAIMGGRLPDRIPWIPRLKIWYDAHHQRGDLPPLYGELTLRDIERDLGMGNPARDGHVFRTTMRHVDVSAETEGNDTITTYSTPLGTVFTVSRRSETWTRGGIEGALVVRHMINDADDYAVAEYIIEHTDVIPTYEEYLAYDAGVGEDGVPLVGMGPDPMYRIIQDLIGYNSAFYHLHDHRKLVLHLYEVLYEHAREVQRIVLASPAKLILHGEHFDSQFTPPGIFRTYMLPYFQAFSERLHASGKLLCCHADADTSRLLELIVEAGFDMAECFVTAPMVPVTLAQARAAFEDRVIIWGGVPSSILCDPVTDAAFETYMRDLFRTVAPGGAFILGVADNVMAEAKLERIKRITQMVADYGACPIDPTRIPSDR
jgi:hypothetical protein